MSSMFITVLNMSLTASYSALAIILVRQLIRKAPKVFSYALWAVVLFRMVCPVSFESVLSLLPGQTRAIPQNMVSSQSPVIATGIGSIDNAVNRTVASSLPPVNPAASVNPTGVLLEAGAAIWLLGIALLLCYGAVSYFRLKARLSTATIAGDNIYETDMIKTAFVMGFINPRIYVPTGLSKKELDYILKHEQTHIRRRDYIIKPVAYLAVIFHWFNPLMWLSYYFMVKDMEMSCDESVMRQTEEDIRENYSNSLLLLSIRQSGLISPLAFGESNVKSRIKNVLNYKRPAFWVVMVAAVVVTAVSIGLMTNPVDGDVSLSVADRLYKYKTEYVGDASKVGGIVSLLDFPEGVNYDHFELFTDSSPHSITVYLKTDVQTGNYFRGEANRAQFQKNAIVMFSLVDNVDYINFSLDDNKNEYDMQYIRAWANDKMGRDVRELAESREEFERLLEEMGYYDNTGVDGRQNIPGNAMEKKQVGKIVEENLHIILSAPKESSNPQDYINAHKDQYDSILKLQDEALDYLLSQFEKGGSNDLRGHIMMRLCKDLLGNRQNKSDESLLPQEWFSQLVIHEETRLPDYVYDGDDPIERLVYATETEQNINPYRGGFVVAAPKIHAYYQMGGVLKVFVTTYYGRYHLYGKALSQDGAGVVPAAITYVKDEKGDYILEEYKQAMDGAGFAESIEDFCTMPVSGERIEGLADLILTHYGNYDDIKELHRGNLIKHLKANNQMGVSLRMHSGSETPLT